MTSKRFEALDGINTIGPTTVANTLTVTSNVAIDTNVLFVNTETNRVGVNKAPTQGALDVNGNIHATSFIGDGSSLTGIVIPSNYLLNNANTTYSNGRLTVSSNSSIVFSSNSFLQLVDGLNLNFGTSASVVATGNTSGLFFSGANVRFNSTTLYIDTTNARIGIGNSAPTEVLHVQGKIRIGTQATATTDAVRADRSISTGDGLSGGGNLTADRTLTIDSTVVRTSGDQTIAGIKTFSNTIAASINGNANTATALQTARNFTIGSTARSFNGTAAVTWSLTDIGAAASSLTLTAGDGLSGGGNLTANRSFAIDSTVVRTTGAQTLAGVKTFSDNVVLSKWIAETTPTNTTGTGTITFNLNNGTVFTHTPGGNFTASFTNFPTSGSAAWSLRVYNGGTARTITFSQTIRWAENIQPPASTGTDIYTFQVINNVIYGSLSIRGANA